MNRKKISNYNLSNITYSRRISKGIGIAACLVVATTGIVFAKDIGGFFSNLFGGNSSDGVQTAVDNGYDSIAKRICRNNK